MNYKIERYSLRNKIDYYKIQAASYTDIIQFEIPIPDCVMLRMGWRGGRGVLITPVFTQLEQQRFALFGKLSSSSSVGACP